MKTESKWLSLERIDSALWEAERYLMARYGCTEASQNMYPLQWYIHTGRASGDFLRHLLMVKPFMIARKLHEGGSDDEVLHRVKQYLSEKTGYDG